MKKTFSLMAAIGLLAACAVSPDIAGDIELPTCDKLAIPKDCDNKSNPETNPSNALVNFNKNSLFLKPRNVCAQKGTTLKFRITPAAENENPTGSVAVIAKNGINTWLIGANSPDNQEIEIEIPDYVKVNEGYEYTIVSVDNGVVSCVDPRVSVE